MKKMSVRKIAAMACAALPSAMSIGTGLQITAQSAHAQTTAPISVLLNGRLMRFGAVPPVEVGGRVLVPLRGVFEALGATVDFDNATNTIFAVRGETQIQLRLGSTEANVNGTTRFLDVPAQARVGRTLVPLRFVSESLGANVSWNPAQRTVYLTTNGATVTPPVTTNPGTTDPGDYPGTTITTIDGTVLRLRPRQQSFDVRTTTGGNMTVRLNRALPAALSVGDRVQVSGTMQGTVLIADTATILTGDKRRIFDGRVISILSSTRLVVRSGGNTNFTVQSIKVLPQNITPGSIVRVSGNKNGAIFESSTVVLVSAATTGQTVDFSGIVERVSPAAGSLQVRGDNNQLYTISYNRPADFAVGERVRVIGTFANGVATARTITRQ